MDTLLANGWVSTPDHVIGSSWIAYVPSSVAHPRSALSLDHVISTHDCVMLCCEVRFPCIVRRSIAPSALATITSAPLGCTASAVIGVVMVLWVHIRSIPPELSNTRMTPMSSATTRHCCSGLVPDR